jgi:hypothetical protein
VPADVEPSSPPLGMIRLISLLTRQRFLSLLITPLRCDEALGLSVLLIPLPMDVVTNTTDTALLQGEQSRI